jgi:predicted nicotinamide N-methyase
MITTTLAGETLISDLERRFLTVNDDVIVGGRTINVIRPRSADELIDEAEFTRDERLPYWAELWPSSTVLANFITNDSQRRGSTIELGAGIGLVSIAAALAGYDVTVSDYYDDALAFARANAYRNIGRELPTQLIDWRSVPSSVPRFDIVLASDVLYEARYAPLLASVMDRLLAPRGVAYVADPGRVATGAFVEACSERALHVDVAATRPYLAGKVRQTITVYQVARR